MVEYKKSKNTGGDVEYKKPNLFTKKRIVIGSAVLLVVVGIAGFAIYKSEANKKAKLAAAKKSKATQGATKQDPKTQKELAKTNVNRIKDRVKAAEKDNSLTKDQANLILKKLDDVSKFNDSLVGKPAVEQGKLVVAKRRELRDWAKSNNIPNSYVSMMIMRF